MRKQKKSLKASLYYTPEEIFYMLDDGTTLENDYLRALVAEALSKVPKKIVDRVIDECIFIGPLNKMKGLYVDNKFLGEEMSFS